MKTDPNIFKICFYLYFAKCKILTKASWQNPSNIYIHLSPPNNFIPTPTK